MDGRLPFYLGRDSFLMVCELGDSRKRGGGFAGSWTGFQDGGTRQRMYT